MDHTNLGTLIGWLKAIARINDKTNYGHHFTLGWFEKIQAAQEDIEKRFLNVSEDISLESFPNAKKYLEDIIEKWFFGFQKDNLFQSPYLDDKNKDFSLTDTEWRKEWTEEFVDLLMHTIKPNKVWRIRIGKVKSYYANDSDDIILETNDRYYHLHLSVAD